MPTNAIEAEEGLMLGFSFKVNAESRDEALEKVRAELRRLGLTEDEIDTLRVEFVSERYALPIIGSRRPPLWLAGDDRRRRTRAGRGSIAPFGTSGALTCTTRASISAPASPSRAS